MQGIEDPQMAEAYDRISRMPPFALFRRNFVKKLKKHAAGGSITDVGCGPGDLPMTEECSRQILSLPLYPEMPASEIEEVASQIKVFFEKQETRVLLKMTWNK